MTAWALILAAAWVPARGEPGVGPKQILLGSCAVQSGPNREYGAQVAGAQAYLRYVNEGGGVNGRSIRLLSYDDRYDRGQAMVCFKKLLRTNVLAGAFFVGSGPASIYAPRADTYRIPLFGFASGGQFLRQPFRRYLFTVRASSDDENREIVDHLWKDVGARRLAVLYQNDSLGVPNSLGVKGALMRYGAAPSALVPYDPASPETVPLRGVVAGRPDAVIVLAIGPSVLRLVKGLRAAGFSKPIVVMDRNLDARRAPGAAGVIVSEVVPSPEDASLPTAVLYRRLLKRMPGAKLSYSSFEGFVEAMILVEGLRRAGPSPTRESLIAALESIHGWDVGLGPGHLVDYGPRDHEAFHSVHFVRLGLDGPKRLDDWKALKGEL